MVKALRENHGGFFCRQSGRPHICHFFPHRLFSTNIICDICDKYELCKVVSPRPQQQATTQSCSPSSGRSSPGSPRPHSPVCSRLSALQIPGSATVLNVQIIMLSSSEEYYPATSLLPPPEVKTAIVNLDLDNHLLRQPAALNSRFPVHLVDCQSR